MSKAIILSAFLFLLAMPGPVAAQEAKPVQLSQQAQQTLQRLNSFDTLPMTQWKYHLGDIPNGEDPGLDDSSWQTITPPHPGLPTEAIWFRSEITIPKQINGCDL